MRVALVLAVLLFGMLAAAPAAPALHGCRPGASPAIVVVGPGVRYSLTFYVVVDVPSTSSFFVPLPWVYEESNAFDKLQRRDDWKDDTCRGEYAPDLLLF